MSVLLMAFFGACFGGLGAVLVLIVLAYLMGTAGKGGK